MNADDLNKLKKAAPKVPADTCPYIDFAQEILKEVADEIDSSLVEQKIELAISIMEYIRECNEALRDGSKYWYNKI
jgi:hypothetical protein